MKSFFHSLNPLYKKRSILRAMIRGYWQICREARIGLFRHVKSDMSEIPFPRVAETASRFIFGASVGNSERVVRQYLLDRHAGSGMNRAILYALGKGTKIVYPLPKIWQEVLIEKGLRVDRTRSSLAWAWRILLYFARNIFSIFHLLLLSFSGCFRSILPGHYAYFDGLKVNNLPHPDSDGRSYDICSWYSHWKGRKTDVEAIRHNVPQEVTLVAGLRVESMVSPPFLLLRGSLNIAKLAAWCLMAALIAIFDLIRGRWWHALLLAEGGRAKAMSLACSKCLADEYFFHFSGSIYRPMWTYEAEEKGSKIICYFYSTIEQPKLVTGYESQKFEWGASSWPLYLVWDDWQKAQLQRDIGPAAEVCVVGPIFFSTSSDQIDLAAPSIAVFDVEPHRLSIHFPQSTLSEYLVAHPDMHVRFLRDVQTVLQEFGLVMALKRKREVGTRTRKLYRRALRELAEKDGVVVVPPSVAPQKVIERCLGVISMPFTSTALILRECSIPSVYYDPTGWISLDDRAAHGIPILIGIDALRAWVSHFNAVRQV
jgi:polysaccharide biosynthesis PFTS motif protein